MALVGASDAPLSDRRPWRASAWVRLQSARSYGEGNGTGGRRTFILTRHPQFPFRWERVLAIGDIFAWRLLQHSLPAKLCFRTQASPCYERQPRLRTAQLQHRNGAQDALHLVRLALDAACGLSQRRVVA